MLSLPPTGFGGVLASTLTTVLAIHRVWALVVIFGNAIAGIWSLAAHWRPALRSPALWWYTIAVEVAVFVQVMLGTWMMSKEKLVPPQFHLFYGFVAIIAVGILYAYRIQLQSRIHLLYGFGGLFIMGLGIRAMLVAGGKAGG